MLFLFAHNLHLLHLGAVVRSLLILLGLALVLWIALTSALKSGQKAGLLISLFLVLVFSYENLFEIVRDSVAGVDWLVGLFIRLEVDRARLHGVLLAVFVVVFGLSAYLLIRTKRELQNASFVANVIGSALVVMTLLDIVGYKVRVASDWRRAQMVEPSGVSLDEPGVPEMLPDIYYIILDGYARADVLAEVYQHDNGDFIQHLSGKGFYVASESRSNYCKTFLSLASSLNMIYLDDLASQLGPQSQNVRPTVNMIWDSDVARYLKRLGYTTVAFSTGWWATEMSEADVYLSPWREPDFFLRELIGLTPVPFLAGQFGVRDPHGAHRERILYAFDGLTDLPPLDGPLFVFAHIIAPHPPFVFGRQGEEIGSGRRFTIRDGAHIIDEGRYTREEYVDKYRDQLIFINSKVGEVVEAMLSESSGSAVVILQADHGPRSTQQWEGDEDASLRERFSILNAYYLPDGDGAQLYDSITPVNTFRVIFNHYFGTELELLEDESYFSTSDRPYDFEDVTEQIESTREIALPQ